MKSGMVIDTKDDGHIMFVRNGGDYEILKEEKVSMIFDQKKLVCLIDTDKIKSVHMIEEVKG